MAVSEMTGLKVYVDNNRWKMMMCYDWSNLEKARLHKSSNETILWVVDLHSINFTAMASKLKLRPDCNRVVGFRPTGWSHDASSPSAKKGKKSPQDRDESISTEFKESIHPHSDDDDATLEITPQCRNGHKIYAIPYSEHSSFGELVDFIQLFR